jgi:twinkle protein
MQIALRKITRNLHRSVF